MRYTELLWVGWVGILGACSTSTGSPLEKPENGQTGSPGYECVESECQASAQAWLDSLDAAPPQFVESRCREANLGPADTTSLGVQHCQCLEADGRVWLVPANGHGVGGSASLATGASSGSAGAGGTSASGDEGSVVADEPCLVWGRGRLGCVLPVSAAPSCIPSEPGSCQAICDRVEQGFAQDAARVREAEVRFAGCRPREVGEDPKGGRCEQIARINGDCYATRTSGFFGATPYDCSLSDEEIFALRDGG